MPYENQKRGRPLRVETGVTGDAARGEQAKRLLKSQLEKNGVNYEELSHRLKKVGISIPPTILNRKINRGTFSAEFFVECLVALGVEELRLKGKSVPRQVPAMQSLADGLASMAAKGKVRR